MTNGRSWSPEPEAGLLHEVLISGFRSPPNFVDRRHHAVKLACHKSTQSNSVLSGSLITTRLTSSFKELPRFPLHGPLGDRLLRARNEVEWILQQDRSTPWGGDAL